MICNGITDVGETVRKFSRSQHSFTNSQIEKKWLIFYEFVGSCQPIRNSWISRSIRMITSSQHYFSNSQKKLVWQWEIRELVKRCQYDRWLVEKKNDYGSSDQTTNPLFNNICYDFFFTWSKLRNNGEKRSSKFVVWSDQWSFG